MGCTQGDGQAWWLNEWAIDLCWAEAVNEIVPKAVAIPRKDKGRIKPKRRVRDEGSGC